MKLNFGMPEVLVIGSFILHSSAVGFSFFLLGLGLLLRLFAFSLEFQRRKEQSEAGQELTKNIVDNILNAITLSNIANGKKQKSGFHH